MHIKRFLLITSILFLLGLFGCSGCSNYNDMLKKIPEAGFEEFSYHRGGNATSATIHATKSEIRDGRITIESIDYTSDWGPAVNFEVHLKGYSRKLSPETTASNIK